MLHPVGPLPSVVYWRRRLLFLAPVLLVALTAYVACSGGSGKPAAQKGALPAGASSSSAGRMPAAAGNAAESARSGPTQAPACAHSALKIAAATGAASYPVGAKPVLYLQVTNTGTVPCVEDLSDPQIVLMVYNGASRVWGSHDCAVTPGSHPQMLPVHRMVRRSITWTGLSSQPRCAGTRQRVGPGRYTVRAELAGMAATTAEFTIGEPQG